MRPPSSLPLQRTQSKASTALLPVPHPCLPRLCVAARPPARPPAPPRSVIAVSFSGNINAPSPDKQGGDLLITITADDKHTIHLWKWMNHANKFYKARNIPGWYYGPDKKLGAIKNHGPLYHNPEDKDEEGNPKPWLKQHTEGEVR